MEKWLKRRIKFGISGPYDRINGMVRNSLVTLAGGSEFIVFDRAVLSFEGSPLSLVVGSCSFFATSTVCMILQARGLAQGTAMSAGTWVLILFLREL